MLMRVCEPVRLNSNSVPKFIDDRQLFLNLGRKSYTCRVMACRCGAEPQRLLLNCSRAKKRTTSSKLVHPAAMAYAVADSSYLDYHARWHREAYVRRRI